MYVRVKLPKDIRRSAVDLLIVIFLNCFVTVNFKQAVCFPLGDNREQKVTNKTFYLLSESFSL